MVSLSLVISFSLINYVCSRYFKHFSQGRKGTSLRSLRNIINEVTRKITDEAYIRESLYDDHDLESTKYNKMSFNELVDFHFKDLSNPLPIPVTKQQKYYYKIRLEEFRLNKELRIKEKDLRTKLINGFLNVAAFSILGYFIMCGFQSMSLKEFQPILRSFTTWLWASASQKILGDKNEFKKSNGDEE